MADEKPAAFGGIIDGAALLKNADKPHFDRLDYDERVERIQMYIAPRYKTSGLSGDEWRQTVIVEFYWKESLIFKAGYHDFKTASAALPWAFLVFHEGSLTNGDYFMPDWDAIAEYCFQPSCLERATVEYKKKRDYSRSEGYYKDLTESWEDYRRRFCERHERRGDCGLDDADANYTKVRVRTADGWQSVESR